MSPDGRGPLVVGVDGGATRTRVLLADRRGGVLARARGGPGLLGAGRDLEVADELLRLVREGLAEVGGELPLEAMCAGLAGAGSDEARALLGLRLKDWGVARRTRIVTDAQVAFVDAFGEGPGILLIAGTGSVALARKGEGEPLRRGGGWGALLGDEGSGYRIGLDGLQAAIRAAEKRGPETALTDAVFRVTEQESLEGLLAWSRKAGKAGIAALAPTVARVAGEGDAVADELASRAVKALVDHVRTLARDFAGGPPPQVALVGGLIEAEGSLRPRLLRGLEIAGFHALRRPVDPARGAIRLALTL